MITAVGATKGIDEDRGALPGEEIVVAVGSVVAAANLGGIMAFVIYLRQQVDIGFGFPGVGVNHHQALVTATKEIDIDQQLDFVEIDERIVSKIMTAYQATLLASEEKEDVGVFSG